MQFEVESTRVAHRFTRVVSPPEGCCVCAGVGSWARYKGGISMLKETFSRGGVASGKKMIPAVGAVHASSPIASRSRCGSPGLGSGGGAKMRIDFE